MEPFEYARFKHTIGDVNHTSSPGANNSPAEDFTHLVTRRVAEFVDQEESTAQRQFGERLKSKLEHLDQEVVKLRASSLVSALDYEKVFGGKIFTLAEEGHLREFCELVQENDVRLFSKRKKMETIAKQLPKSFSDINSHGYFSPLLVAI
jgi:hypothetical protein